MAHFYAIWCKEILSKKVERDKYEKIKQLTGGNIGSEWNEENLLPITINIHFLGSWENITHITQDQATVNKMQM